MFLKLQSTLSKNQMEYESISLKIFWNMFFHTITYAVCSIIFLNIWCLVLNCRKINKQSCLNFGSFNFLSSNILCWTTNKFCTPSVQITNRFSHLFISWITLKLWELLNLDYSVVVYIFFDNWIFRSILELEIVVVVACNLYNVHLVDKVFTLKS